jgi:hypothetical protein
MPTTQENIYRAIKLYNSCFGKFSKFTNMLPWTEPIPDRISHSIELLKQSVLDFKIQKDLQNQIKYSLLIDEYYDELYKFTLDRTDKTSQSINLKELILLCDKDNKQNFINNKELKYDIFKLIEKYIMTSEETSDDNRIESCYKFMLEYYINPNDTQIDLLCDIHEKLRNIKGEYNEKYIDLIVYHKNEFMRGGEIYEELASNRVNKPTKFSIDLLLLKAFLCYLCIDEVLAERKLNDFDINYPIISNTMNYKFCINIMETYRDKDVDKYTDIVREFNSIKPLDDYMVMLLNKIKKQIIQEEVELC